MITPELAKAIDAALSGDWHTAHQIVQQDEHDPMSCWIHAVLHKLEGDTWNSHYWYARTHHEYQEWENPIEELLAIRDQVHQKIS